MVLIPEKVDKDNLAFPHARIVNMVRSKTREGQFVRKDVYVGLNLILKMVAEEIINEMVKTENAFINKTDLDLAAQKFENVELILKEKQRIIAHLLALKEDVDKLVRDLERAEIAPHI